MGNVGKTIARAVTAVGTMGLSEATGMGKMITGGVPKQPSPDPVNGSAAIKPVTDTQKQELDQQAFDKARKSKIFTTLLTSRAQRSSSVSTLQPSLEQGALKKTLG